MEKMSRQLGLIHGDRTEVKEDQRAGQQRCAAEREITTDGPVYMGPRDRDKGRAEGPTDLGTKSDTPQSTRIREARQRLQAG